ncbi:MAG: HAD family hydrolase [Clostridia bacterium]|nr:HAD family hydrolase [Clostridia bacterium]
MIRLLIFDMDGTLYDTSPSLVSCANATLRELGLRPVTRAQCAAAAGGSVRQFVEALLSFAGDEAHRFTDVFWEKYVVRQTASLTSEEANRPYPGIRELLRAARERGVLLAVLSNKDPESVEILADLLLGKDAFALKLGNAPDRPPKPHPAGALCILEKLGVKPEEALYLGDTEVDLETARRAGIPAAGVLWGYRTREQLAACHPAYLPETPFDVIPLLDQP